MPYADLLNGIDEIAEKLTTAEYQNLMGLLQKSQHQETETNEYFVMNYNEIICVPFSYYSEEDNEIISEIKTIINNDKTIMIEITDCDCCNDLNMEMTLEKILNDGKLHNEYIQRITNYIDKIGKVNTRGEGYKCININTFSKILKL